eukprot:6082866-Pyramimonas_sp.AAC.1
MAARPETFEEVVCVDDLNARRCLVADVAEFQPFVVDVKHRSTLEVAHTACRLMPARGACTFFLARALS